MVLTISLIVSAILSIALASFIAHKHESEHPIVQWVIIFLLSFVIIMAVSFKLFRSEYISYLNDHENNKNVMNQLFVTPFIEWLKTTFFS